MENNLSTFEKKLIYRNFISNLSLRFTKWPHSAHKIWIDASLPSSQSVFPIHHYMTIFDYYSFFSYKNCCSKSSITQTHAQLRQMTDSMKQKDKHYHLNPIWNEFGKVNHVFITRKPTFHRNSLLITCSLVDIISIFILQSVETNCLSWFGLFLLVDKYEKACPHGDCSLEGLLVSESIHGKPRGRVLACAHQHREGHERRHVGNEGSSRTMQVCCGVLTLKFPGPAWCRSSLLISSIVAIHRRRSEDSLKESKELLGGFGVLKRIWISCSRDWLLRIAGIFLWSSV